MVPPLFWATTRVAPTCRIHTVWVDLVRPKKHRIVNDVFANAIQITSILVRQFHSQISINSSIRLKCFECGVPVSIQVARSLRCNPHNHLNIHMTNQIVLFILIQLMPRDLSPFLVQESSIDYLACFCLEFLFRINKFWSTFVQYAWATLPRPLAHAAILP